MQPVVMAGLRRCLLGWMNWCGYLHMSPRYSYPPPSSSPTAAAAPLHARPPMLPGTARALPPRLPHEPLRSAAVAARSIARFRGRGTPTLPCHAPWSSRTRPLSPTSIPIAAKLPRHPSLRRPPRHRAKPPLAPDPSAAVYPVAPTLSYSSSKQRPNREQWSFLV